MPVFERDRAPRTYDKSPQTGCHPVAKASKSAQRARARITHEEKRNGLRRWLRHSGAEEESQGLSGDGEEGVQGVEGLRRARLQGMRRRRREDGQVDLVPA